jgi:hypothetical protein
MTERHAIILFIAALFGCSPKPAIPQIVPIGTTVNPAPPCGVLVVAVDLDVYNPNAFALTGYAVESYLTINSINPVPELRSNIAMPLAPKSHTTLHVPVGVHVDDILYRPQGDRPVPFVLSGTLGTQRADGTGEPLPKAGYRVSGSISRADFGTLMANAPRPGGCPGPF